ncbi:ENR1 protein, partial [Zosterops hypoxanthus]|nr:ENR1 protein [Zosterops hypoxanthus]
THLGKKKIICRIYKRNYYCTELNSTHCWTCGGMQMIEQWPWRGEGLRPEQLLQCNQTEISRGIKKPEGWVLSHKVIGEVCITRQGTNFTQYVGHTPCKTILITNASNQSWWPKAPEGYWGKLSNGNCI